MVLRRHLQLGNIIIPKSVNPERIRQNLDVFDFTGDERAAIAGRTATCAPDRTGPVQQTRPEPEPTPRRS